MTVLSFEIDEVMHLHNVDISAKQNIRDQARTELLNNIRKV